MKLQKIERTWASILQQKLNHLKLLKFKSNNHFFSYLFYLLIPILFLLPMSKILNFKILKNTQ